jgi:hypothetical protein
MRALNMRTSLAATLGLLLSCSSSKREPVFNLFGLKLGMPCGEASGPLFQLQQNYENARKAAIAASPSSKSLPWRFVMNSRYDLERHCLEGGTANEKLGTRALPIAFPNGTGFEFTYGGSDTGGISFLALDPTMWSPEPSLADDVHRWVFIHNRVTEIVAASFDEWKRLGREQKIRDMYQQSLEPILKSLGPPLATVSRGDGDEVHIWKLQDRLLASNNAAMLLLARPSYVLKTWNLDLMTNVDALIAKLREAGVKL